jgi:hypothetical protein
VLRQVGKHGVLNVSGMKEMKLILNFLKRMHGWVLPQQEKKND